MIYDRQTMKTILEAVKREQGRYHQRDGKGPSNPTYVDIVKRTGMETGTVVEYLREAERRGYIAGQSKNFRWNGHGGAKRWTFIRMPSPEINEYSEGSQ